MIPDGPYMDMHTHILPGLDDGSESMDRTRNMLLQAYDEGIRVIVATPHFGIRNPDFRLAEAEEALRLTQAEADRITPGIKLILGNELYYTEGIVESLNRGESKTIGGTSYALVEFSTGDSYERILKCIREMTWNGYIPLIAHLERYRCMEGDIEAVRNLTELGAVIQINCRSFMDLPAGSAGSSEQGRRRWGLGRNRSSQYQSGFFLEQKGDWVRMLLREGLVHLIASDCHDDGRRRPVYRSALEAMEPYCDEDTLYRITRANVLHLIRNERIS